MSSSGSAAELAKEKKRLLELLEENDYDSAYIITDVIYLICFKSKLKKKYFYLNYI
jgi:hypothetical protein